jgi:putative transposase
MDTDFCVGALKEAMNQYGVPRIFNTDQGSKFTSFDFTQAQGNWFRFYNEQRPHIAFKGRRPMDVY